ncbi:hypothetical protein [Rhodococcus opacus]|nr:hypothetical protein [Rhodococcus opacus]
MTDDMHVADSIVGVDGQRALHERGEEPAAIQACIHRWCLPAR